MRLASRASSRECLASRSCTLRTHVECRRTLNPLTSFLLHHGSSNLDKPDSHDIPRPQLEVFKDRFRNPQIVSSSVPRDLNRHLSMKGKPLQHVLRGAIFRKWGEPYFSSHFSHLLNAGIGGFLVNLARRNNPSGCLRLKREDYLTCRLGIAPLALASIHVRVGCGLPV